MAKYIIYRTSLLEKEYFCSISSLVGGAVSFSLRVYKEWLSACLSQTGLSPWCFPAMCVVLKAPSADSKKEKVHKESKELYQSINVKRHRGCWDTEGGPHCALSWTTLPPAVRWAVRSSSHVMVHAVVIIYDDKNWQDSDTWMHQLMQPIFPRVFLCLHIEPYAPCSHLYGILWM